MIFSMWHQKPSLHKNKFKSLTLLDVLEANSNVRYFIKIVC
jgi:hypothetical protein